MLKFRPHHFFCTLGFQGKGYSDAFIENYSQIKDTLTDETRITVVPLTDSICEPCPNRQGSLCNKQETITRLDNAHQTALGLNPGDILTWRQAKEKLTHLSLEDHHRICEGCSWRDLGLCAQALKELKNRF